MKKMMTLLIVFLFATPLIFPGQALGAQDWFGQGLSFLKAQQYEEAIRAFSRAIEIEPECVEAYNNRGIAWCRKGNYERAIANYTRALEIDPCCAEAYNNRGAAWFYKGDHDHAMANYTKALEINPDCSEAYNNLGAISLYKGDYEQAIANYTRALELDPHCAEACKQLAWILAACPDHKYRNGSRAVELAKKAEELDPKADFSDIQALAHAEAGKLGDTANTPQGFITLLKKKGPNEEIAEKNERLRSREGLEPDKQGPQAGGEKASGVSQGASKTAFSVQVGAFLSRNNAEKLKTLLKEKGYAARLLPMTDYRKRLWHTVRIGDYATHQEARENAAAFSAKEKMGAIVRPIDAL